MPLPTTLADALQSLADLETRVGELEAWRESHTAGMRRRTAEISALSAVAQRDRWLASLRRGGR